MSKNERNIAGKFNLIDHTTKLNFRVFRRVIKYARGYTIARV